MQIEIGKIAELVEHAHDQHRGEPGLRVGRAGIERQRRLEIAHRFVVGLARNRLCHLGAAAQDVVERIRMGDRAGGLGDRQLGLQCAGDARGDLVLQREQIAEVAVEPLRPELRAGCGIDQLDVDPHFLAGTLDAAFDDIAHAELAADLARVDLLALVGKGGVAGDHHAALDPRQVGGQIVGDAVGEIFLLRIVAEIGERQHDHGQPRRRIGLLVAGDQRAGPQPPRSTAP